MRNFPDKINDMKSFPIPAAFAWLTTLVLLFHGGQLAGQDTFSIVAVDEESGEIGSAGASCVVGAADLGGVIIISEILPGRGAINGQATICIPHINLNNGIEQMEAGLSPQEVLDWLYDNDACPFGNNESRQYGVVDFDENGSARAAAFTGSAALNHAGQRVGSNYAIQGNILLGPEILDAMETAFLNASGSLAERLMAAMQGANVPGADSRCLNAGTSSTSAFLQVYQANDPLDAPTLRLNVAETATGVEPIDSLQVLFDAWLATSVREVIETKVAIFPNPASDFFQLEVELDNPSLTLEIVDLQGRLVHQQKITGRSTRVETDFLGQGRVMIYRLLNQAGQIVATGKLLLE